jgi:hypothetical protein
MVKRNILYTFVEVWKKKNEISKTDLVVDGLEDWKKNAVGICWVKDFALVLLKVTWSKIKIWLTFIHVFSLLIFWKNFQYENFKIVDECSK